MTVRAGMALIVLVASGCIMPAVWAPLPATTVAWTNTNAQPWIVYTIGCGFCGGQIEYPEAKATVLYESGQVLWFDFGIDFDGKGDDEIAAEAQPISQELKEILPLIENGYVEGHRIKVHHVATGTIPSDKWPSYRRNLDYFTRAVHDPGPPNYDCEDCGSQHLQLIGTKEMSVTLHLGHPNNWDAGNYEESDPWGRIIQAMRMLQGWLDRDV